MRLPSTMTTLPPPPATLSRRTTWPTHAHSANIYCRYDLSQHVVAASLKLLNEGITALISEGLGARLDLGPGTLNVHGGLAEFNFKGALAKAAKASQPAAHRGASLLSSAGHSTVGPPPPGSAVLSALGGLQYAAGSDLKGLDELARDAESSLPSQCGTRLTAEVLEQFNALTPGSSALTSLPSKGPSTLAFEAARSQLSVGNGSRLSGSVASRLKVPVEASGVAVSTCSAGAAGLHTHAVHKARSHVAGGQRAGSVSKGPTRLSNASDVSGRCAYVYGQEGCVLWRSVWRRSIPHAADQPQIYTRLLKL